MLPKIEVLLLDRRLSIRYSKENNSDNRGDNLRSLRIKWSSILLDLLAEIVQKKAAVVHVYSSDGDFQFPDSINAKIWTQTDNGITYFLAASNTWMKSDVTELISLMEFELSSLWIQIVSEIDESKVDPVGFFRAVNKIVTGEEEGHSDLQCIGNTEDGDKIIWENPNWSEVDDVLLQLKTFCSKNDFECQVEDKRNKT